MPNTTRLYAYIDMPGHLGQLKLLCVGSPATGLHGSPGDKKDPPCFCLYPVLSKPFAQEQCWVRDAGQEGQSGSTEAVAMFSAMGAGRMHKWGAMGNGQCPKQVVAVRRGFPSLENNNYVLKTGRRRNWGAEETLPSLREKVPGNSLCGFAMENVACQTSLPSIMMCLFQWMKWEQWANLHFNTASRKSLMVFVCPDWIGEQPGE